MEYKVIIIHFVLVFFLCVCNACDLSLLPDLCEKEEGVVGGVRCVTSNATDDTFRKLPNCTRRLSICQRHPKHLSTASFGHLQELEELVYEWESCNGTSEVIPGYNMPEQYSRQFLILPRKPFVTLPKLQVLVIRAFIPNLFSSFFTGLPSLRTLTLSRIHKHNLELLTNQLKNNMLRFPLLLVRLHLCIIPKHSQTSKCHRAMIVPLCHCENTLS